MTALVGAPVTSWEVTLTCDRCLGRAITMSASAVTSLAAVGNARDRVARIDSWASRTDERTGKTVDLCQSCDELQKAGWQ